MSTVVLLTITGLGLAAMYFLVASGLSLIYGLMGVLNFAHGALITVGAYGMWFSESKMGGIHVVPRFRSVVSRFNPHSSETRSPRAKNTSTIA